MADDRPVIAHVLLRLVYAGAEVLAGDLARRMSDRYRFIFLCLDDLGPLADELSAEGFTVINLKREPGIDLKVAKRIRKIYRRESVNLVHAHQYSPFFYASLGRGARGLLRGRPRVLFTEHGRHYPDSRSTKRVWANRVLLRRGDRVSAVGQHIANLVHENEGVAMNRVQVIHNGIDPDRFAPLASARAAVRQELNLSNNHVAILQVARFHPVKDHDTAVRAFADAHARCRNTVLLLAGDGEERDEIEQLAAQLGVRDSVRFLGVRTDIPRLMAAADLFMLSSLSEGISVTLLEAMAAGLPIAATEVGGNPEVVDHDRTGLLSPRRDAAGLASHLVTLTEDADLRKRMGEAGRTRLLEHFTQARMHAGYGSCIVRC